MNIVFLHPNFPAQFVHLASYLAKNAGNKVLFLTQSEKNAIQGVEKVIYKNKETLPSLVQTTEKAVRQGQGVFEALLNFKKQGFYPDLFLGHSGWGPTLYMQELFPNAAYMAYFEWFNVAKGADIGFGEKEDLAIEAKMSIRVSNVPFLIDLVACDQGISPTYWQKKHFPLEFHSKIKVCHDGINTDVHSPQKGAKERLLQFGLDLTNAKEVITYVARGKDIYRGFPQFMEAVAVLQRRYPKCHVVIVGADHSAYGKPLPNGKSYKLEMLERFAYDQKRLHFTGLISRQQYIEVLRVSDVHVYLTRPYVLSWSAMEAMSVGCLMVASDTPPVLEVMEHKVNALLTDFFDVKKLVEAIEEALTDKTLARLLRQRARETILEKYDLRKLLPKQLSLMQKVLMKKREKHNRR